MRRKDKAVVILGFILLAIAVVIFYLRLLLSSLMLQKAVFYCQAVISALEVTSLLSKIPLFLFIFLLSATLFKIMGIFYQIYSLQKHSKLDLAKNRKLSALSQSLGIQPKTILIQSNQTFAFCFGFKNPKIYLSSSLLSLMSKNELKAILYHEKFHLEHHDSLIVASLSLLAPLFPFLPLLFDISQKYLISREIKADEAAVIALSGAKPIIGALKKILSKPSFALSFVPAIGNLDSLEPRIKALMSQNTADKKISKTRIFITIFSIGMMILLVLPPVRVWGLKSQNKDNLMLCAQRDLPSQTPASLYSPVLK